MNKYQQQQNFSSELFQPAPQRFRRLRRNVSVRRLVLTFAVACFCVTKSVGAADNENSSWTGFRNGGTSRLSGTLPLHWSPDKGIAWQVETDGYGQSAPVVAGGRVFVASVIGDEKERCAITAFALKDGRQLWQHRFDAAHRAPSNYMMSRSAPTPIVDRDAVYVFFESGDLVAVSLEGQQLWHRDLTADYGVFNSNHGLGSSPAQTASLILLNIEHKGPSFLLAVDKRTSETRWKTERPSGSSWTTPVIASHESGQQVVVSSGGDLSSYDPESGKLLWSIDGLEGNSVPSPCAVGELIFSGARIPEFGSASDAARSNLCVRITGDASQPYELCWRAGKAVSDYASPVVDGEQVYFLNKVGVLFCVDIWSGETIYQQRLRTECWATPIITENGIYFFAKDGTVKVIQRGREFSVVATNQLWDKEKPPAPETYREAVRANRHGAHGGESTPGHGPSSSSTDDSANNGQSKVSRAEGMIAAMMKGDSNGDGILQATELSPGFRSMLKRVDTNGDGELDSEELTAMAESFTKRRQNSRASSRDPIVYGVAAVPGIIIVRTGTRLFCVAATGSPVKTESDNVD